MSHVLGIGFWCDVYKKNPRVRVFFDGQFLEEYELRHDPVPEWGMAPNGKNFSPERAVFRYPEAKLFAIEDHQLEGKESIEIRIDVENDDNNYTNGFMTKSTLLDFRAFLLPLKYLKFFYHDGYKVRKDFNEDIIDDAFDSERYFDPEGIEDNNFKIANEKRYYMIQGVISNGVLGKNMFAKKIEGYPFAYDINWNGKPLDTWQFGGSGKLTMNLVTKASGTVLFDPKDEEILKMQNEKTVEERPGFYISQKFFSMVHQNMFDKYLYNENL